MLDKWHLTLMGQANTHTHTNVRHRLVAYDHHTGTVYALAVHEAGAPEHVLAARGWVDGTLRRLRDLPHTGPGRPYAQRQVTPLAEGWVLREGQAHYHANVESCVEVRVAQCV